MMHYRSISLPKQLVDRIEAVIPSLSYASISEYIKEKLRDPLRRDEMHAEAMFLSRNAVKKDIKERAEWSGSL